MARTEDRSIRVPTPSTGASLATKPFILLCLATALGYANHYVLMPVIPLYVHQLGGTSFMAGLVLLAFAVPSFIVRPFVGRVADRWSAAGVLAVGLLALATGTLPFLVPSLALMFAANAIRGLGWAGLNTGGLTLLVIAAPANRRSEASGYYNSALNAISVVFPALGLWLIARPGGFQDAFLAATLLGLLGLPVALALARRSANAHAAPPAGAEAAGAGWIDRGVLLATGLNLCTSMVNPAVIAFLPLYARSLGIENIALFYVVAGVTTIVLQPLLGRMSDAIGHGRAIGIGFASQLAGLLLIILADGLALIVAGGFFAAIGAALIGSVTTALAMELADPRFRGRAMATYSMSWQLGAGAGALLAGALADLTGFRGMYVGCVVITVTGLGVLAAVRRSLPRRRSKELSAG